MVDFVPVPSPFCSALAGVLIDEIKRSQVRGSCVYRSSPDPDLVKWVNEAETGSNMASRFSGQVTLGHLYLIGAA